MERIRGFVVLVEVREVREVGGGGWWRGVGG